MSKHGEHPRMGYTDVCPLVQLQILMEETASFIDWEKELDQNSVFQYIIMKRHKKKKRKNLKLRSGEYEGLSKKLIDPQWKPDFWTCEFNKSVEKSGGYCISVVIS